MARKSSMRERARERAQARKDKQSFGSTCLKLPAGSNIEFYKPEAGLAKLDILPYVVSDPLHTDQIGEGELWYGRRYFVHRNVGAEEDTYVCPAKTWGERCPICDYAKIRREAGADKNELASLRPKERQIFNVIDTKKDPDKILLWDVSYFLFGVKLDEELTEGDDDWAGFAELVDGYTLHVRFKDRSFDKITFQEASRIDFRERDDYDDGIIEECTPLDDILVKMPYDELERIFHMEPVGTPKGDDDDEPAPRSKRGAKTPQSTPPEDEEDAPPKRRGRGASKDSEEEDVPKPRRGSRAFTTDPEEDNDDEPAPRSRRASKEQEEEAPKTRRASRRRQRDDDDD